MSARTSGEIEPLKPPPLQTSGIHRPSPAPHSGTPSASQGSTQRLLDGSSEQIEPLPPTQAGHQRFVLTDPVAFRYLEEDHSTTVLGRRRELQGYECYVVEQWTTSRMHPTFVITTYTGDPSHVVVVGVLSVPTEESTWSPRLRVYFKALNQYHARRRETPLGIMMVTNLSGFPSSLNVVRVSDGDVKKHRFDFFVNENLKRLGCSGRMGLTLSDPAPPTIAKFHQLYRTSDKNEIYKSVVELVKLCQSALMLFDKLEIDYSDGLLCDVTERAINDWWIDIGNAHYNIEPHDGILGPTTVAGLLGLLMGARNRLHSVGCPVAKDPFDVEAMKRGISVFQKQQRLERTRRLDRHTLDRLHKATQKSADKERWVVPKAVKSTIADLSNKGGDIEAISRRDRATIAEIETVDMDRFVQLVFGDRCKWLWLGKPLKKKKEVEVHGHAGEDGSEVTMLNKGLIFKTDEHGGFTWAAGRKSTVNGQPPSKRELARPPDYEEHERSYDSDEANQRPQAVQRSTDGRSEPRTNLEKVRDVVSFRGHKPKPSTDEPVPLSPIEQQASPRKRPAILRAKTSPTSTRKSVEEQPETRGPNAAVTGQSNRLNVALNNEIDRSETRSLQEPRPRAGSSQDSPSPTMVPASGKGQPESLLGDRDETVTAGTAQSSVADSIYNGTDPNETLQSRVDQKKRTGLLLQRTVSNSQFVDAHIQHHSDHHFPRHLSFSLAEDNVLVWPSVAVDDEDPLHPARSGNFKVQLANQTFLAEEAKQLRSLIQILSTETTTWTTGQLSALDSLVVQATDDHEKVEGLYYPRLQEVQSLQAHSAGILRGEKEHFEEGAREIETLAAKLEYEINALKSKVEDVEIGVSDFKKGVVRVEERVAELEREGERRAKWDCVVQ